MSIIYIIKVKINKEEKSLEKGWFNLYKNRQTTWSILKVHDITFDPKSAK